MTKKCILNLLGLLISANVLLAQPGYMDFSEYGFKQKFPTGGTSLSKGLIFTEGFVKGYEYMRTNASGGVKARIEIYRVTGCNTLQYYEANMLRYLKGLGTNANYYSNATMKSYYNAYGWQVFKGEARKSGTVDEYRFFNAYISMEYMVYVDVLLQNQAYWDIGYGINADKSEEMAFEPVGKEHKLGELDMRIRVPGIIYPEYNEEMKTYAFYKCSETPAEFPNFNIRLYTPELRKLVEDRFKLASTDKNTADYKTEAIQWNGAGQSKFKNGKKVSFRYEAEFPSGKKYPLIEEYYTFDFGGKTYLVVNTVVLKDDPELRGFRETKNFGNWGREIAAYYGRNLLKILETIEKL